MPQPQPIERLREKIVKLIDDNRAFREQAAGLRRTGEKLRAERNELRGRVAELEHRVGVLELSGSMRSGSDKGVQENKRARARVNRLMREVDKCIALISKQ